MFPHSNEQFILILFHWLGF